MSSSSSGWRYLTKKFRQTFRFPANARHNWFPGHMDKGLRQIQRVLASSDCVIEVHDARIPFSGRNISFRDHVTSGALPYILVLNKADLLEEGERERTRESILARDDSRIANPADVYFVDCKRNTLPNELKKILPKCVELVKNSDRYHREGKPDSNVLVCGIPNVGKSSLINILRNQNLSIKGRATSIGNKPGVTRAVLTKIRINDDPLVYLIDTPGIMNPNITNMHVGMKLALCSTLLDHQVGMENMADYLLFYLNKTRNFTYVDHFMLGQPTDNYRLLLSNIAIRNNLYNRKRDLDTGQTKAFPALGGAAELLIEAFRNGEFGRINLDSDILEMENKRRKTIRLF